MGIIRNLLGDPQAVADHKDALAELERVSKRDGEDTDDVAAAADWVIMTEKNVPWWRR